MKQNKEVISVIGLGVVGLTNAVGLALTGHRVIAIDIDADRVNQINQGFCPIYETGLSQALNSVAINATADYAQVLKSDISFVCCGTPPKPDGGIDLYYLEASARQLLNALRNKQGEHTIVIRSTLVPGTTENVILPLLKNLNGIRLCVNPEFLREGTSLADFLNPDRIVIGANDRISGDRLHDFYSDFHCPILRTDIRTAEMIKQASNAYLATRISFINEIGNICKKMGIDVNTVAEGMGYDKRIGRDYLSAGVGFGGFCLPKDLSALMSKAHEVGYKPRILEEVMHLNQRQPLRLLQLLKKHIPSLQDKRIGVLGLAFKPGTDDIRTSKSIEIIDALLKEGAKVTAHDPRAIPNFRKVFPQGVEYDDAEAVLAADAILILTAWDEFNHLDYRDKIVIDGRGILKAKEARIYEGICW